MRKKLVLIVIAIVASIAALLVTNLIRETSEVAYTEVSYQPPEPQVPRLNFEALDLVSTEDIAKPDYQNVANIPVLMYHHINTIPNGFEDDAILFGLSVAPDVFDQQMSVLAERSYHTLTIDEYTNILNGFSPAPQNSIMLVFDDGYQDNYEFAFPILEKYNLKGNFALVSGVMSTSEYMSWEGAQEIADSGHGIISHTTLHCSLATKIVNDGFVSFAANIENSIVEPCPSFVFGGGLTTGQVEYELSESKNTIEENLGISVSSFVYPFGNYNAQTVDILEQSGYTTAFTIAPSLGTQSDKPLYELPRIRIHGQQTSGLTGFFAGL